MKAEILTIGTELLMGQVVNTNSSEISQRLNEIGVDVYYHTTVGDNPKRMEEALRLAESRSDCIILCGGLGPTEDDLTKQILAKHLGEKLVRDEKGYQRLLRYFENTGREHTPNNDLQVLTLENGEVLDNDDGIAVGTLIEKNGKSYATLPGPPSEMRLMLQRYLIPKLVEKHQDLEILYSKTLRFYGIGESQLTTKLSELIAQQTDPTIAPYAKMVEVTLRISTKAQSEEEAMKKLEACKEEILQTKDVRDYYYGEGEETTLPNTVVDLLKKSKKTISAAESLTCGLFQSMIGEISGASSIFKGGFVTYSEEEKVAMLGISETDLQRNGVVSEYCAMEMARLTREKTKTDIAVSFTGVAGPEPLEGKEAGMVFIGISTKNGTKAVECHFSRSRNIVRLNAAMMGFDLVRRALL